MPAFCCCANALAPERSLLLDLGLLFPVFCWAKLLAPVRSLLLERGLLVFCWAKVLAPVRSLDLERIVGTGVVLLFVANSLARELSSDLLRRGC